MHWNTGPNNGEEAEGGGKRKHWEDQCKVSLAPSLLLFDKTMKSVLFKRASGL